MTQGGANKYKVGDFRYLEKIALKEEANTKGSKMALRQKINGQLHVVTWHTTITAGV